jgi:hypothetical protein
MPGSGCAVLDFAEDPSKGGNKVATDPTGSDSTPPESDLAEAAYMQAIQA